MSTTIAGKLENLGTGNVSSGTFVRFYLRGTGGNQPRVDGTAVIAPSLGAVYFFDFVPNASGVISGTLWSTRDSTGLLGGDIEVGGVTTAVWYGMVIYQNGKAGPEVAVHAKNGSTLDITSVTPISVQPVVTAPTGDSTYMRLDAGNSPATGAWTFSSGLTAASATVTGAVSAASATITGALTAASVTSPKIAGIVEIGNSTYACSSTGLNAAIAANPNGAVIDTSACTGTPQITSTVSLPQGIVVRILPGMTWQASACPAFKFTGEGAVLEGTAPGNSQAAYTTGGVSTSIIQAITGCSGPLISFDISAGTKAGVLRNIRLDVNSISTVTIGIDNGTTVSQVARNHVQNVVLSKMTAGTTCLRVGTNSQNFLVDNFSAELCATGIDASTAAHKNTIIQNSRITCSLSAVPCVVVGTDDAVGANTSQDFQLINDDIETVSATPTMLVKVQNCRNFHLQGGWYEADSPSSYTTMIVLGDGSSTPLLPSIINSSFYGDSNVSYGIELNNVLYPSLFGNLIQGTNVRPVKNTSGATAGNIIGNNPNNSGLVVDSLTGLVSVTGNSTPGSDRFITPLGLLTNQIAGIAGAIDYDAFNSSNAARVCRNACSQFQVFKGDNTATQIAGSDSTQTGWQANRYTLTSLVMSNVAPTIAGAGCGGSGATIANNNGTAAFEINVGSTPGSACTVTMPTASHGWACSAVDVTTNSTLVFVQKQSPAASQTATQIVITNFSDAAAASAFTASDVIRVHCSAY